MAVGRSAGPCRLLRLSVAILVAACLTFATAAGGLAVGPVALWIWAPLSFVVATVSFWRTSASAHLPAPTRRFWRQLGGAAALVTVAFMINVVEVVRGEPALGAGNESPALLLVAVLAVITVIVAVYRFPLNSRTQSERFRVTLDGGAVVLTAGMFVFEFHTWPLVQSSTHHGQTLLAAMIVMMLVMLSVFAVAKVALSRSAGLDAAALRMIAAALAVGGLGPTLQSLVPSGRGLAVAQVSLPVVALLTVLAGERQRSTRLAAVDADAPRRRPFSVLPYAAVAAADALMVKLVLSGGSVNRAVAAVVTVGLTAIVVVRQFTVLNDNQRLLAELEHSATHDVLTGLPNRALLNSHLTRALAASAHVAVALLDLNGFKAVNDTLGHDAGDALLVVTAQRLRACLTTPNIAGRLGGDEFVVIFPGSDARQATAIADRIERALAAPLQLAGQDVQVTVSIGIAVGPRGSSPEELIRDADVAMYRAKRASREDGRERPPAGTSAAREQVAF
jgi:diguanylate cyclase (GGDEF)-like protein